MNKYLIISIIFILIVGAYIIKKTSTVIAEPFYTLFLPYNDFSDKEKATQIFEETNTYDLKILVSESQWHDGIFSKLIKILISNNDINIGKLNLESMIDGHKIIHHVNKFDNHVGIIPAINLMEHYVNYPKIRYITTLYDNHIFFLTQADNDIIFVNDLKGKHIGVGAKRGLAHLCADEILTERGRDYQPFFTDTDTDPDYHKMIGMLSNRELDAVIFVDRYPSDKLHYAFYNYRQFTLIRLNGTEIVNFYYTVKQIDLMLLSGNFIPKITSNNAYLYFNTAMTVLSFPNYVICSKNLSEDVVYRLTDFFFKNADIMDKNMNPFLIINIEMHQGAIKYYRKKGYISDKPKEGIVFRNWKVEPDAISVRPTNYFLPELFINSI